jgi:gentisate 1,2-dioxygenase
MLEEDIATEHTSTETTPVSWVDAIDIGQVKECSA